MEKFLDDLRGKSPAYKKRFAFLTSSSFTALMFTTWALFSYGLPYQRVEIVAESESKSALAKSEEVRKDDSPFENLKEGVIGAVAASGPYLKGAGSSIVQTDFRTSYMEMRNSAFEKYGR